MNKVKAYLQWLINPTKKGKEYWVLFNFFMISVLVVLVIDLLGKLLTFGFVKELLIGVAALITSIIAFMGLSTWREQLRGKTDYDIARNYLKSTLHLRNELQGVRNPMISLNEQASAVKEKGDQFSSSLMTENQKQNMAVYSVRWDKVIKAWQKLDDDILEAEVSWGSSAERVSRPLIACTRELHSAVYLFLSGYSTVLKDNIIYNQGSQDTPDEFSKKILSSVEKIEEFLAKYLR
jgi:hypothetical protein